MMPEMNLPRDILVLLRNELSGAAGLSSIFMRYAQALQFAHHREHRLLPGLAYSQTSDGLAWHTLLFAEIGLKMKACLTHEMRYGCTHEISLCQLPPSQTSKPCSALSEKERLASQSR